ncbi:MAG: hypothetical protein AAF843_15455 [Bacteroidota bacterium]
MPKKTAHIYDSPTQKAIVLFEIRWLLVARGVGQPARFTSGREKVVQVTEEGQPHSY